MRPERQSLLPANMVEPMERVMHATRGTFQVPEGPQIAYLLIPPGRYDTSYTFDRTERGANINFSVKKPVSASGATSPTPEAGTVVLIHGWSTDRTSTLPWAAYLANSGYTVVLPDLRSHGLSEDAPVGYGVREAQDLRALLTTLRSERKLREPLHLMGVSYGAVTAIHLGALLGDEVDTVVALAPYVDAATAIHGFVGNLRDTPARSLRGRAIRAYARQRYDDARVDLAIERASRRLDMDLRQVGIMAPLRAAHPCTVLIQGARDQFFDPAQLREVAQRTDTQLLELGGEDHVSLSMRIDLLAAPLVAWWKDSADCPRLALPEAAMTGDSTTSR